MKVRFIYLCDTRDTKRESVITAACQRMSSLIELPKNVEIEFSKMDLSVYAQTALDPRFPNRVRLNQSLSPSEVLRPLIHELIHVHQIFTKQLSIRRDGTHIWQNRQYRVAAPQSMTYDDYSRLPWEADVANREKMLLEKVLNFDNHIAS